MLAKKGITKAILRSSANEAWKAQCSLLKDFLNEHGADGLLRKSQSRNGLAEVSILKAESNSGKKIPLRRYLLLILDGASRARYDNNRTCFGVLD